MAINTRIMKGKNASLLLLWVLGIQCVLVGQTIPQTSEQDAVAYEVYSAVLASHRFPVEAKPKLFVIRRETVTNFGTFRNTEPERGTCLRPDAESNPVVGAAIDDFVRVNKRKWRLGEKFKLDTPYKLIEPNEVLSLTGQADWDEFYRRYPGANGFVDFSAVGFNPEKTVAVLSVGRWCGGLCGEGEHLILQRKDGKWVPLEWKGDRCFWAS
jgi:hypothetical protein